MLQLTPKSKSKGEKQVICVEISLFWRVFILLCIFQIIKIFAFQNFVSFCSSTAFPKMFRISMGYSASSANIQQINEDTVSNLGGSRVVRKYLVCKFFLSYFVTFSREIRWISRKRNLVNFAIAKFRYYQSFFPQVSQNIFQDVLAIFIFNSKFTYINCQKDSAWCRGNL